jgi:outer membrane protein assembly factor BamB
MNKTCVVFLCAIVASQALAADWSQWGNGPGRNMVNPIEKDLPTAWDVKTGHNIRWMARVGSQAHGNPVVAAGTVFVGANNESIHDPEITGDRGNILAFRESDGQFVWQAAHDKLSAGRVNDWPLQGICSTVWVEGNRAWYLNNRCEVVCIDPRGFQDGKNNGMQDEQYKGKGKADLLWIYDMIEELGVFPHNLATSSPLVHDDLVMFVSGNGVDEGHLNIPSGVAPSFVAFKKDSGALAWEFTVEERVLHGQWSSPSLVLVKGKPQAVFPGGDGWIYALEPATGTLIWKFNCNPASAVWELGGYGTKNNIIATPVCVDGKVFIGVGQDPEHGTGRGHLWCIDATGTGDVTGTHAAWHLGDKAFGRTMSTVAVHDGLLYVADLAGIFYCIDAATGAVLWTYDLKAAIWGSPLVVDGKIYIGDEKGDVAIFKHGRTQQLIGEVNMGGPIYTTPVAANGVLYISTKSKLYAIADAGTEVKE